LAQSNWVALRLLELAGGPAFELVQIKTSGDSEGGRSFPEGQAGSAGALPGGGGDPARTSPVLGDGIFVKEIQRALLSGEVDLAVHSLKDMPTEPVKGLIIAAIPVREDPSDALVGATLLTLGAGARVGTSSPRRAAQLRRLRPDLNVLPIHGNVPTRVDRVAAGEFDAVMLATAGLIRLGLPADEIFDPGVVLPAPGQGALAIEVREQDGDLAGLVGRLHDPSTHSSVAAERRVLSDLGGGCLLPVAAWGRVEARDGGDRLVLDAAVTSADGKVQIRESDEDDPGRYLPLAKSVARSLIRGGAREILEYRS